MAAFFDWQQRGNGVVVHRYQCGHEALVRPRTVYWETCNACLWGASYKRPVTAAKNAQLLADDVAEWRQKVPRWLVV